MRGQGDPRAAAAARNLRQYFADFDGDVAATFAALAKEDHDDEKKARNEPSLGAGVEPQVIPAP